MIIFLSGKAGAGKDAFAEIAVEKFGAKRAAFADTLKEEVENFLTKHGVFYERRHLWGNQEDKEAGLSIGHLTYPRFFRDFLFKHGEYSNGGWYFKSRTLLQWWGSEYRRQEDPDYWVKRLLEKLTAPDGFYVITDGRFPNELDTCKAAGAITVRVEREPRPVISGAEHPSEVALDHVEDWDYLLLNDGSLEEYREKVGNLLEVILSEKRQS